MPMCRDGRAVGARLGDIGEHFPDTDPAYKGISSIELLRALGSICEAE